MKVSAKHGKDRSQSPASQRSATDFGMGSSASSLLRKGFSSLTFPRSSGTLHNRLSDVFRKIVRSSPEPDDCDRILTSNISLLKNFELNSHTHFETIEICINATSEIRVRISSFNIASTFRPAPNTDTAILRLALGIFDFKEYSYKLIECGDLLIELKTQYFEGDEIVLNFSKADGKVLIVAIAVFFVNLAGTVISVPEDRKYNAGKILEALAIRGGKILEFK